MMQITVVMKIYWGDPREKICEAVEHIPLSSLVIGNRGLGGLKRLNISPYFSRFQFEVEINYTY